MMWRGGNGSYRWVLTLNVTICVVCVVLYRDLVAIWGWLSALTAWLWLAIEAWQDHRAADEAHR